MDATTLAEAEQFEREAAHALAQGNLVKARDAFERACELAPTTELLHQLATVCFELGLHEEAIGHLYKALELDPVFFEGLEGLATLYHVRGNLKRALAFQEQAVQVRPGDM